MRIFIFIFLTSLLSQAQSYSLSQIANNYLNHHGKWLEAEKKYKTLDLEIKERRAQWLPQVFSQTSYSKQKFDLDSMFGSMGGFSSVIGSDMKDSFGFGNNNYSLSLGFNQNIYLGGGLQAAYSLSHTKKKFGLLKKNLEEKKYLFDLFQKLSSFKSLSELTKVYKSSFAFQKNFLSLVKKRQKTGLAKPFEFHQVQADYYSFLYQIESVKEKKEEVRMWFDSYLKLKAFKKVVDWPKKFYLPKINSYLVAAEKREDVKMAFFEKEVLEAQQRLERAKHLPQVSLRGILGYRSHELGSITDKPFYQGSLNFTMPLFSGGSWLYENSRYELLMAASKDSYQFKKDEASLEIKIAHNRFKKSQKKLALAQKWSYHMKKSFQDIYKKYKQGAVTLFEVIQVQKQYHLAQVKIIEERQKYWLNWFLLELALGKDVKKTFYKL